MGLELREAALEDAADQKGSLDEVGGPARLDHSRWGPGPRPHAPDPMPPRAGELALQKPLAQRLSKRYDHQR